MKPVYKNYSKCPLIINACITGGVLSKDNVYTLPVSPLEIFNEVSFLHLNYKVQIFHIHVRDKNGHPSSNPDIFKDVLERIRNKFSDIILCVSLSGRSGISVDERCAVLEHADLFDMASVTLGSMNFKDCSVINSPNDIQKILSNIKEAGIKPEFEIFDHGMVRYLENIIGINSNSYINFIFGNEGTMGGDFHDLLLLERLPDCIKCVGGIGYYQYPMNIMSLLTGNHVRVGLEDNFRTQCGNIASNNDLIKSIHDFRMIINRPMMSINEIRIKGEF